MTYIERLSHIEDNIVNVERSPGEEEYQTDSNQHLVCFPPSCKLPDLSLIRVTAGWLMDKSTRHSGVEEANADTWDEVLNKEAGKGVGKLSVGWLPTLISITLVTSQ